MLPNELAECFKFHLKSNCYLANGVFCQLDCSEMGI